jgi:propionyl-CoA carboxylase alpha chain
MIAYACVFVCVHVRVCRCGCVPQEPEGTTNFELGEKGIRCDSGVGEGSDISTHYDPMISKLITWGADRTEAINKMTHALDTYVIRGVTHNVNLLRSLCVHPRFVKGDLTTAFLAEEFPNGYKGHTLTTSQQDVLLGTTAILHMASLLNKLQVDGQMASFLPHLPNALILSVGPAGPYRVELANYTHEGDTYSAKATITTPDKQHTSLDVSFTRHPGSLLLKTKVDKSTYMLQLLTSTTSSYQYQHMGTKFDVSVMTEREAKYAVHMPKKSSAALTSEIVSPMPGVVFALRVQAGDSVEEGQELAVLEAMKMQNALLSPRSGKIKKVCVKKGDTVQAEAVLIEFE